MRPISDRAKVLAFLGVLLGMIAWSAFALAAAFACSVTCGCSSVRDDVVTATNASADFAGVAERTLEDIDKREQQEAVALATTEAEARAGVAAVRKRYAAAWSAYRKFRVAWLAAAASERAYDSTVAAKQAPDVAHLLAAAKSLADAEQAFTTATIALTQPLPAQVSK